MTDRAGSREMRRLGKLARAMIQPFAKRPWLIRPLMRSGLLARDFPLPRRTRRELSTELRRVQGRKVWTLAPKDAARDAPLILYLHGGAYVCGITTVHWHFLTSLAQRSAVIEVPLYGLGPKHDFREAYALLDELWAGIAQRHPGRPVTIMGDSAGGGLALGFALHLRDSGRSLPESLVLLSPWVDIASTDPQVDERRQDDPMLARAGAELAAKVWANGADPDDPRLSPMNGDLTGLPPTDIYQGTRDMLRPQVEALADKLRAAGVRVDLTLCPGGLHVYPIFDTPESKAARDRISARLAG
ncbi:alpha/beta hydrolase [Paracoccus sp. MC1862]|uniref:alpha/beta hydrolase n=1 Tax=Paracoccus sp. MC1862 TaxID=2760307 RepID=UPI001603CFAE|nr:alpha/beta hydrolase [Paracoccus sp. MC1862]MBB1497801.1 alpha/beta hydrolase [Paracoccus sp. MC1862]QQO45284.1 alpha/beta hydrolase [Paracoccus sp. MC1862]